LAGSACASNALEKAPASSEKAASFEGKLTGKVIGTHTNARWFVLEVEKSEPVGMEGETVVIGCSFVTPTTPDEAQSAYVRALKEKIGSTVTADVKPSKEFLRLKSVPQE